MTLETKINKHRYVGNGETTQFPFAFKAWKKDQVKVIVGDGETERDETSQCAVNLTATGGTVTFDEAPAAGTVIVVRRSMPYLQEDDYRNGSRFDAEDIEDRLDQDCAERQDLLSEIDRCAKVPETSAESGADLISDIYRARDDAAAAAAVAGDAATVIAARDAVVYAMEHAGEVVGATLVAASGTPASRSIADRFADFINVRDFGAKGDGETDDTEAIQAALDAGMRGGVYFPHGVYVITQPIIIGDDARTHYGEDGEFYVSCVPTVDLDGSALVWGGESGADNMVILAAQSATLRNGKLWGAPLNDPSDTHVVKNPLKITTEYGLPFNARVTDLTINGYSEAGIRIGDADHMGSYGCILDRVYITSNYSIADWENSGPAGIDVWGADCKFSNIVTQRNKRHFWLHTSGHQIVNCHMVSTTKNQSANHDMPETAGIWYSLVSVNAWYQNVVSNCYFDNVKYVIYNEASHRTITQISNSFYFNAGTVFDHAYAPAYAYLLGGPVNSGSPVTVTNFSVQPSSYARFLSGVECSSSYAMMCRESYCHDYYSSQLEACPWLAKFKIESGRPARVLDSDLENNKTYCIGGVFARSLDEVSFRLKFTNRSYAEIDVEFKNVGGSSSNWECIVNKSWGSNVSLVFEVHTPMTVNVRGTDLYFVPLCVKNKYGSTWSGVCQATLFSNMPQIGLYLIHIGHARYELTALKNDSGIEIPTEVKAFARLANNLYNGVPLNANEDITDTTSSLNTIRKSGVYPVVCDSNTTGAPFVGYGLLEVFTATSRSGITSYPITLQRITDLYGSRAVYQRSISGSDGSTISAWKLLDGSSPS